MTVHETPTFDVIGYVRSLGKTGPEPKVLQGLHYLAPYISLTQAPFFLPVETEDAACHSF